MSTYICFLFDHDMISEILFYTTAAILFIQTLYWGLSWVKILNHYPTKESTPKPTSVIVCAHNEIDNLKELIPLLLEQDHPEYEIIVVNDRSNDGTYDFLLNYNHPLVKPSRVDTVHDHITAKKYAITLGVKAAQYERLLFIDADCRPDSSKWIQSMTNNFEEDTNFSIGVSLYNKGKGLLNYIIRLETLFTAINYTGFALLGNPYMGVGRNLAYRKSNFLENKGFNKYQRITGGDDDLLVNQLAKSKTTIVALGKDALNHSIPKTSWGEWLRQKTRHISVSKHYRFLDKLLLGIQNLTHSLFWVSLVSLALSTDQYILPAGLLLFRMFFMAFLCHSTSKRFGDRMNIGLVPILDVLYVFYVSIVGTKAIFTKNVRWK
ncbi:glycosyltransferase [Reichenbachiella versicolor]|uniref:glycosyltransferase n=1 Tax=Reichenbachiella versicolor TaxID=1821036 RepID=UPI000D6E40F4|nr:glycosyltransferase [Reichenbachiella versicolor]